jgi:replication factor C subunit 2/4
MAEASKGKAPVTAKFNDAEGYEMPWWVSPFKEWTVTDCRVEKYRPILLDDVVGNSETVERLKVIAEDGNVPHIIISVSMTKTQAETRVCRE